MAQYKCFTGNYDGRRYALVIATSQKRACEILKTTLSDFRKYYDIGWRHGADDYKLDVETLYTKPIYGKDEWVKGICDLNT